MSESVLTGDSATVFSPSAKARLLTPSAKMSATATNAVNMITKKPERMCLFDTHLRHKITASTPPKRCDNVGHPPKKIEQDENRWFHPARIHDYLALYQLVRLMVRTLQQYS